MVSFLSPYSSSAQVDTLPYGERLVRFDGLFSPPYNEIITQDNLTCILVQWFGFENRTGIVDYSYLLTKDNMTFLKGSTRIRHTNIELKGLALTDRDEGSQQWWRSQ